MNVRTILDPEKLKQIAPIDCAIVARIARGLKLYGKTVMDFSLKGFDDAFRSLEEDEIKVVSCGYIYAAKKYRENPGYPGKNQPGADTGHFTGRVHEVLYEKRPGIGSGYYTRYKNGLLRQVMTATLLCQLSEPQTLTP